MTALLLGARLAIAGGRQSLVRGLLTALGVALGVALLLIAASVPSMISANETRTDGREAFGSYGASPGDPGRSDRTVLVGRADTEYRGAEVFGRVVEAEGGRPVLPPGVDALPAEGEMLVSPALDELLRSGEGRLLAERLDARVVGTIGDQGLAGPRELAFYRGASGLDPRTEAARVEEFGAGMTREALPAFLTFLVAVGVVVLLLPVAAFIATAVRFGGEDRDRRLAALRLVGADRAMAARIATGETLVAAVGGMLAGALLFLACRPVMELVELEQISVFARDVRPDAALAALILVGVPLTALGASLVALRRVVIEPLGVVRRGAESRRRVWWRVIPAIAGALLLHSMRGDLLNTSAEFDEYRAAAGVLLVLVGVTAVLPWVVEVAVRRMGGGGLSWQLATRRLQMDGGTAARVVSGVAVAVAGAIALQTLFTAADRVSTYPDPDRPLATADLAIDTGYGDRFTPGLADRLRAVPGVRGAAAVDTQFGRHSSDDYATTVLVGDCASLRAYGRVGACADGDAFVASGGRDRLLEPRHTLILGEEGGGGTIRWRVPADAPVVRAAERAPDGNALGDVVLATPGALDPATLPSPQGSGYVDVDPAQRTADTIELVRNVAAPGAVHETDTPQQLAAYTNVRRAIFAGTALVLLLIGASILVGGIEQLRERRRVLAVLTAFGTRRRTLAWSVLWQAAVPVVLGLAVSVAVGIGLSSLVLAVGGQDLVVDWGAVAVMAGLGAGVILLVTVLTLPALLRLTSPSGLRTE